MVNPCAPKRPAEKPPKDESEALTDLQKLFIEHYLQCLNATEAAVRAGYGAKDRHGFQSIGSENLSKPIIRQAIDARLKEVAMGTDEIIARLASQARGSMDDFIDAETGLLDFKRAREAGKLHLLKKVRVRAKKTLSGTIVETVEFEQYDAQAALIHLHKMARLDKGLPSEIIGALPELLNELQKAGIKPVDYFAHVRRLIQEARGADSE